MAEDFFGILFYIALMLMMISSIVSLIFYIIYQKTEKIHVSLFATFCPKFDYFTFIFKRKKVDEALLHYKRKGYYYILGLNGIYKFKGSKLIIMTEETMTEKEKQFIGDMKEDCKNKIIQKRDKLEAAINKYYK